MADGTRDSQPPAEHGRVRGGFVAHVLPALLWAVAIFVGGSSGMPQVDGPHTVGFDKVEHALAFFGLQILCFRALRYEFPERPRRQLLWLGALAALAIGVALELYQLGLPDRSAEVADALADGVGAGLGALLLWRVGWF
jgi:VanZ family protein